MGDMSATTLVDLLGRQWTAGSPVRQVTIDRGGTTVAFGLADGRVALAPVDDAESALKRFHRAGDTGRATIVPRRRPQPPLVEVALQVEDLQLSAFGEDFLVGGADGLLRLLRRDGSSQDLADSVGPVGQLLSLTGGSVLVCGGRLLLLQPDGRDPFEVAGSIEASATCAASHDGRWLAIGGDSLAIQAIGGTEGEPTRLPDVAPLALAWSPDGRWLAAGLQTGGLVLLRMEAGRVLLRIDRPAYPAPVRSLSWDATGVRLATSGAFRIIVWSTASAEGEPLQNLPTGRTGLVAVEDVAFNPGRPLVAAALESGTIAVAPIGGADELVVRPASADAIGGLAWTPDGTHLAFGTQNGNVALVTFPPQLFKS